MAIELLDRQRIEVVGMGVRAQQNIQTLQIRRFNGDLHHPNVLKSGSLVFLRKGVGKVEIDADERFGAPNQESRLADPCDLDPSCGQRAADPDCKLFRPRCWFHHLTSSTARFVSAVISSKRPDAISSGLTIASRRRRARWKLQV